MRTIEVIEFRDITRNDEDGFSARLRVRLKPAGTVNLFTVLLSGTVAAPAGFPRITRGDEDRGKVMAAMRAAAQEKIFQDSRHEFPAEEKMVLKKRDIMPFVGGKSLSRPSESE